MSNIQEYIPNFPGQYLPGGTATPIGHHSEGHRTNAKRFSSYMIDGLHWVRKRLNGPGAMNYAFDSLALAESTCIGPGIAQRKTWMIIAPPLFVNAMVRPASGYGGVAQGQTLSQPLFDPYNNVFGTINGN